MRCPELEQLAAYHTEALRAEAQARVREHIAGCAACRRELHALANTARLLEATPAPDMPDTLWPGIAARITPRQAHPWRRALAGAGLAAVCIIGALTLVHHLAPEPPYQMATATTAEYTARHAFLAARDPLADRAALGVALIAQEEGHR